MGTERESISQAYEHSPKVIWCLALQRSVSAVRGTKGSSVSLPLPPGTTFLAR